jgi:hypothetical protein
MVRAVLALVLALLFSTVARADVESPTVKKGMAAYADLDYARAVQLLEQARKESLTREEKIAVYQTLAMAHVGLGQLPEARGDFQRLLRLEPSFQLDRSVAPKVRAVFEEAKGQVATSGRAVAAALPEVSPTVQPAAPREGRPITLRVAYAGGVAQKMTIYYRKVGTAAYSRVDAMGKNGEFEATIPGLQVQPPAIEYHIALLDDAGASVAAAGSLGTPRSIAVQKVEKPVYTKGWFWGVMGGIAAAGALATTLALVLPRSNTAPVTVNAQ